jgi:hypothetical protein
MGSVCGATVIYLSASTNLGDLILIYEGCQATFHVHDVM